MSVGTFRGFVAVAVGLLLAVLVAAIAPAFLEFRRAVLEGIAGLVTPAPAVSTPPRR